MSHLIVSVDPRSPAERAGVRAGDRLTHLQSQVVVDFLDYQALSASRRVRIRLLRDGRALETVAVKGEYDSLGMNFSTPMMSGVRMCCNKCLFCFVDQLPEHVRESMRVKDDDWRMSLMMGNYVTLTNVSDRELERIIQRRASPLYVSVHAWDPDLRVRLLQTPRAAKLPEQLRRLSEGGIEFHCQAVLCPGLNDGPALEETIARLTELEGAKSLALVPVGLSHKRNSRLNQLSGGEQQRIAIAIALANSPKLLLADEPTGSVDVKTGAYILDMFRDINRSTGLTIVIVTHDRLLAKKVNRVVTIRDGKISSERILKQSYLDRLHDITSFTDVKQVQDEYAILDRAGRVQLPRELLDQLELTGNKVRLELVDGRIVIEKPEAAEDAE